MLLPAAPLILSAIVAVGNGTVRSAAHAERAPFKDLTGVVTDIANEPIPNVEVSIVKPSGNSREVTTGKDGRFSIKGVPEGNVSVRFRRLGYEVRVIEVRMESADKTSLDVVLKPVPEELEAMLIKEDEQNALREFYEHKKQRSSYGKFFTADEIRRRGAINTSDMLRNLPGVRLSLSSGNGNTVKVRGCSPMLWIDGQRVPNSEVDDIVSPGDIAGLEFYQSMAGIPAPYMDRSTRACGAILVWTKNR